MATPFFDLIEELRALSGAPKVTYPTGDNNFPQTERTIKAKRGSHILALGTPEPDGIRFPNNVLTDQIELRADAQIVEVYRKYEVLPGPFTRQGQEYDPEYGLLATYTEGEVRNAAAIGTAKSDVTPENYVKSVLRTWTIPTAALDAFYLTFPGTENIDFPRVLAGLIATWDIGTGSGNYIENGSGFSGGSSANLAISLEGSGQGSGSVLGDLSPIYAPQPPGNLPVLDYFFFLPNPVTLSAILTRCTQIATALAGTATTVSQWPVFMLQEHTFIVVGQKLSVSARATAKCAVSISSGSGQNGGSVSESVGSGGGSNEDVGSSVKAITIPGCIHGAIDIIGSTRIYTTATAGAIAAVQGGTNFPGASGGGGASAQAVGSITPPGVAATPQPGLPASGLYLYKPDVQPYKWGYSAVRARIFDFGVLTGTVSLGQPQITTIDFNGLTGANFVKSAAQITTVDFTGLTGANFVTALTQITTVDLTGLTGATYATGSDGLGFLLPSTGTTVYGVWLNTGTETQPTLAGATTYLEVTITPSGSGSTAAQITSSLATAIGTLTGVFTATAAGAVATVTSASKTAQTHASDVSSTAVITVTQAGSTNNPGRAFLLPSSSPFLGTFGVWFDTGTESAPALAGSVATYLQVTISPTATASAIATALAAGFSGQTALWTVGASGAVATFTSVSVAAQGDASDVNSGAAITMTQQGGAMAGNYFLIYGYQARGTAIWFNTGNEIAPALTGVTTIGVTISPTASAADIAAAVVTAVPAAVGAVWTLAQINGGSANTAVQFTAVANATTASAVDVNTGAAITTVQSGQPPSV